MKADQSLTVLYASRMRPLMMLAQKAYGSRDTISPQHDASREYTRLICEFASRGGSLTRLATELGVTYAGLRRRLTTSTIPASSGRARQKFDVTVYEAAVEDITRARMEGTSSYHCTLKRYFDEGLSMARIATHMGLSSANPLYYGIHRATQGETPPEDSEDG